MVDTRTLVGPPAMLAGRLKKNLTRLGPWLKKSGVTCFRAYDRDIPELPLAVDVYGAEDGQVFLMIIAWSPKHGGGAAFEAMVDACADVAAEALHTPRANVVVQFREPGRGGELEATEVEQSSHSPVVREGRARFRLQLGARRDPGLFLDHRPTRSLVADVVKGRRLLNLFAYTGSFSVQAGLAGAASTLSVDLSVSTCRWAEENLALNNLRGPGHRVVVADALGFLDDESSVWDVIVVDPPSFSKSRRTARTFDVQRDHGALIAAALARLAPGGEIIFSCNRRDFRFEPGTLSSSIVVDDLTAVTTPPDFRGVPHHCFRIRR